MKPPEIDDCARAPSDHELLRMHVETRSEESFRALMARYVDLVYSSAMRQVGNHATAQDITQAVFTVLARKAASLSRETVLAGWLVRASRYAALDALKLEARRLRREREAAEMRDKMTHPETELEAEWDKMAPFLDEALSQLSRGDRNAVVLRFFEKRSWREVGETLGSNENAARVRVGRAVEKLRSYFRKRGVAVSSATLTGALLANSVQAAPAGLLAGASFVHSPLVALLLRRLLWPKIVTGAVAVALLLLFGLTAWRLWPAAVANTAIAAPPPTLDTNQQAAIAREARAVLNEMDRGLFFNDPQAFVGQINFRNAEEERYRPLLLEYARVSNEFRSALATASPTGRAPSRSYRVILEEIFEGQPAPAPVILTRTYATDNAFKSHGIHLVKTNGVWKWNFFAPYSTEARAQRMAVLEKKTAVMKLLLPSLRDRSLTNAYEALDRFKLAAP
jgi:RNA polymerase sigma factor (sigma-70 family)